jgi:hypothetical protein
MEAVVARRAHIEKLVEDVNARQRGTFTRTISRHSVMHANLVTEMSTRSNFTLN